LFYNLTQEEKLKKSFPFFCGLVKNLFKGEIKMAHLSEAAVVKINEICDRYVNEKTPLIMILSDIQKEYGYIPLEVQEIVSQRTGISVAEIYGVVTFYSFFSLKPNGKYVIGCCLGTACYVKGAQQIVDKFSEILGIKPGETTEDGLFTIDALRCIGACAIAPAVTINGKVYPHVQVSEVQGIVDEYKAKEAAEA
jgi:NADH:ubiquinone oxidoreductase subunit E